MTQRKSIVLLLIEILSRCWKTFWTPLKDEKPLIFEAPGYPARRSKKPSHPPSGYPAGGLFQHPVSGRRAIPPRWVASSWLLLLPKGAGYGIITPSEGW